MKRLTRRDEDTGQVYAMSDKQSILDKLCLYEEAEECGDTVSIYNVIRRIHKAAVADLRSYAERKAQVNGVEYANGILAAACRLEDNPPAADVRGNNHE